MLYNLFMEFAENKSDIWRNEQDRINYSSLLSIIQKSYSSETPLSVFVGGGLSRQAGYPSSNELIEHLVHDSMIDPKEINTLEDFPSKAKRIKELIEDSRKNFYEILYRRFDENHFPINSTIPAYLELVRIPFKSFITSNYDSCIEKAAEFLNIPFDEIQVYPRLRANDLKAKKIYHIHGKIDQKDIPNSSRSIILTSDDYSCAYGESSALPVLMNALFDSHHVLFIGFSQEEEPLNRILHFSKKRNESIINNQANLSSDSPYKFAILPISRIWLDPNIKNEEEIKTYKNTIDNQDLDLKDNYGVIPIRYKANEIYSEIKTIVNDINNKTLIRDVKVEFDLVNTGVPV